MSKVECGLTVVGGKGKASRKTLQEIEQSNLSSSKIEKLQHASKLIAKVDNNVLQDRYQLYHHAFFFNEQGKYVVVQQGMNDTTKYARRYHWLSDSVKNFVEEPHAAVCCDNKDVALDLTALKSRETRKISLDLIKDNPQHFYKYFNRQTTLSEFTQSFRKLSLPARHWIQEIDLTEQDKKILQRAYEIQPRNYEDVLS